MCCASSTELSSAVTPKPAGFTCCPLIPGMEGQQGEDWKTMVALPLFWCLLPFGLNSQNAKNCQKVKTNLFPLMGLSFI